MAKEPLQRPAGTAEQECVGIQRVFIEMNRASLKSPDPARKENRSGANLSEAAILTLFLPFPRSFQTASINAAG